MSTPCVKVKASFEKVLALLYRYRGLDVDLGYLTKAPYGSCTVPNDMYKWLIHGEPMEQA